MNIIRKITVVFLAAILAAAIPVVAQAKGGGGGRSGGSFGGGKGSNSSSNKKQSNQQQQQQPAAKVDVNSATLAQLTKLPGITKDIANQIIAARPIKSLSDLKSKKILTSDQYNAIKNLAVANKPASQPKTKTPPATEDSGE